MNVWRCLCITRMESVNSFDLVNQLDGLHFSPSYHTNRPITADQAIQENQTRPLNIHDDPPAYHNQTNHVSPRLTHSTNHSDRLAHRWSVVKVLSISIRPSHFSSVP